MSLTRLAKTIRNDNEILVLLEILDRVPGDLPFCFG